MAGSHHALVVDPRIAVLVDSLTSDERENYEERAGIRQHDGGLSKGQAEAEALLDVLAQRDLQPYPPLRVFRLTLPGDLRQWVLAYNPALPLAYLHKLGGSDIAEESAVDVLNQQFDGLAFLVTFA